MTSILTSVWLILMFFLAHWAGSWHWIAFLLIKYVYSKTRPVLSRSIMSILSHAADSSAVLGVYKKEIWSTMLITNRQLETINTESIPSSSVLEWSFWFHFESERDGALCCRCMVFDMCIEGEWRTGRGVVGCTAHTVSGWLWFCGCCIHFKPASPDR